ncbi:glycosyltransferase [Haliea sp. E1-2-M8]|uniref:glycosyltransferase n=1 Tax=Haliea sp. E1-2-M8 TaxID=3064706 RepID=UPI002727F826|nr:glycosyltransferase [Haliea sp. E1-2-M8]MDO8863598.1 glycosyltransferase [Haliea sp. E1-2-M8]
MTVTHFDRARQADFRPSLASGFNSFLEQEETRFAEENRLRIDLHCHDLNSDQPDELWGRILRLPETWLESKKLVQCLRQHGSDVVTVTNHNNARSCWQLLEKGEDVLVGAEFTCHFPDRDLFVHVLTYGFSPAQEEILNRHRRDIYQFLRYAAEHDLPVILPHPLFLYAHTGKVDPAVFELLALLFQRVEVLNGQRDLWQSTLTLNWARGITPEKMQAWGRKHRLNPDDFGVDPQRPKVLTGGSDDHMGIFAGQCGSFLEVPDLQYRLLREKPSALALEAIRKGRIAPYGHVGENQKLNIALLDYFSQVATRIQDPGLLRILLHRGETRDKLACLAISNTMLELQKKKHARKFFEFVHDALQGKKPNRMLKWKVAKKYRFCLTHLQRIAASKQGTPEQFVATVNQSIGELFTDLNRLLIAKVEKSGLVTSDNKALRFSTEELTRNFEIPAQLSALVFGGDNPHRHTSGRKVTELLDSISFPLMISAVLAGATVASTRLLYQNRQFLNNFAQHLGSNSHNCRALHLTDTLFDRNGVSSSLTGKLRQIQQRDLPIDLLVCDPERAPEPHLLVFKPLASYTLPDTGGQQLRIPDLLQIGRAFYEGGYDRVVCSTEGPMVLVALFLKYMFNVRCYFFMHTDWLEYIKATTDATPHERDRIRRLLRLLYQQFDGVFVLNTEHKRWLTGHEMELEPTRVFLTAHQAPEAATDILPVEKRKLFPDATAETPVLFIACRLSQEKGLGDLPQILARARQALPDLRLVIAGSGPEEEALRQQLPDAVFLGWTDQTRLAQLYQGLDLFVFPSRFDTFGNVLLEAFAHGMPAVAYATKGPADIIQPGVSGYLAADEIEFAARIVAHFQQPDRHAAMRTGARARAAEYEGGAIMDEYLRNLDLPLRAGSIKQRSVA